jgi:hypothetical protein
MSRPNSLQKAIAKLEFPTRREVSDLKKRVRDLEKKFEIYVVPDAINVNGWASRFAHLKADVTKLKERLEGSWDVTQANVEIVTTLQPEPKSQWWKSILFWRKN